jgi:non-specific serine/threonine protein kinase/serine/threonine-protein kinase
MNEDAGNGFPHDPEHTDLTHASDDFSPPEPELWQIGPYRLLEKLGEGGIGEVWRAEQTAPVRREVAVKFIKPGMDTRQVVARFEAERQALALMDHPAIASVHDAGATPRGRPYFVMERVRGVPITEHCDRHKLSNRERIELFIRVCEGVQHAHQKAVIHRDIKPSNVLVSIQDGRALPKIIDFGVAKATSHRLTDKTMLTRLGVPIGTPEYMSPEQAEMTGQDIDTRTDVYALGVMLYELLVGALPFEPRDLRQTSLETVVRRIREEAPPRPSTRVSTLGDRSSEAARRRRTDPSALRRELTGDLDWITMKALEKDRTRRYGSPQELAEDLRRHLRHEPVLAGPPSTWYRTRKFARRHTTAVVASAAGLFVLVVFAVTMTLQAGRVARERDRANREAEARAYVSEFLKGLFAVSDPGEARGNSITARELLDEGAEKIDGMLEDQPETRAELMSTMGEVYTNLGLYPQAEPLLEQALGIRRHVLGDEHPDTLTAMNTLAALYWHRGRFDEAEPLFLEALPTRKRVLGDDHPDTLASMNDLAGLYWQRGRYEEAEPLLLETVEARRRVLGNDHPDTLTSVNNLAVLYENLGRYAEAEPLYVRALEAQKRVLGSDHPETLRSMNNLAVVLFRQGRLDDAEPLYAEVLRNQQRVLGTDHPETLRSMNNLAALYRSRGRFDEAEPLYLEVLEIKSRVLGDDHPESLLSKGNLGELYTAQGQPERAEPLLAESLAGVRAILPQGHVFTGVTIRKHGACLAALERYDEAEAELVEAHEILAAALGEDHDQTRKAVEDLVALYDRWGRSDRAARWSGKLSAE